MTLRTKLLLAQLPLALSLIVVGVVSRKTVVALDYNAQDILKDNYLSVLAAQRMRDNVDALSESPDLPSADRERRIKTFEHDLEFQETNITEPGEREMTARARASWVRLKTADQTGATLRPIVDAMHAATNEIVAVNQDAMVRKSDLARMNAERNAAVMVGVTVAAFVLGILASIYLTSLLTRPLSVLTQAVRRLGQGDLAARVRLDGHDEIAQVAREINTMANRLSDYHSSSLGELLQAQQSSQAAIDSLPDPVLLMKSGGEVLAVNRAAEELFGVDTAVATALDRAPPEVRAVVKRVAEHMAAGRGAYVPKGLEDAIAIVLKDGTRYYLARANPVVDERNRPLGFTILFQDVTRMRRLDELKTDMVATVAHEFRTPLTSLHMAIHLCVEGTVGPLSEKQADLLFTAREDCERLQGIVDDLLDLSRIQAGKIELKKRVVSSTALLAQTVDDYRTKGVELVLHAGADRPLLIDPDRVHLVLTNLVENALRHSPAGGHVELGSEPQDHFSRFQVHDDGPGIAAEFVPRLFERFFRLPDAPPGGAGLGLYICKEIVESHGGSIGVISEPGHGATFWFTLPNQVS